MSTFDNGKFLKQVLVKRNISEAELARQLNVKRQTINQHVKGKGYFEAERYLKISKFLDVSIDDLLYGGKPRVSELKRFFMKPIENINLDEIPDQPDSLGNTLLDYVIESGNIDKFHLFYEGNKYKEVLHNNMDLIVFLIKNNQHDFLKKSVISKIDYLDKTHNNDKKIEFPIFQYTLNYMDLLTPRKICNYYSLDNRQRKFVDAVLDCEHDEILDMLPYEPLGIKTFGYPLIYFFALTRNKEYIVKYYIDKYKDSKPVEYHFHQAIKYRSTKVAKYLFERIDEQTIDNVNKIRDTIFVSKWTKKILDKTEENVNG